MPDTWPRRGGSAMTKYVTRFGSLEHYAKGGVEIIDDDPKRYTFSNMFEVAARSKPYEKVAVGKNMQYVLEVLRDRKSTRLNSSHSQISYAVFCLKKRTHNS